MSGGKGVEVSSTTWRSWSGLEVAHPHQVLSPSSTADVVAAVHAAREAATTVKMVGTGHSFTGIAVADGIQLLPHKLVGITAVDREALTVTCLAGTPLQLLNTTLERLGLSLHNMGDIAEQTVAGATSTGTHGTGGVVASLSAQVVGLELVTGDGTVVHASEHENPDVLAVARLGLGALGIVTSLTFRVEPLFTIEAHEGPMSWSETLARFDEMVAEHYYVEAYWFPHTDHMSVKRNDRTLQPAEPLTSFRSWLDDDFLSNTVFGWVNTLGNARPSLVPRLAEIAGRALSERTYSDVAHKVFTSPRKVVFREMEYAVPREAGLEALREARSLIERRGWRISFPIEIRVAPADDVPLSTASARDSLYLAFHVNEQTDHTAYFTEVERLLRTYDGRPHWGKLHTRTAADLAPAYPRWSEFQELRDRHDPERVFGNAYLTRVLGP
ncbi:MAG: L-gulono,4-lactone dehydrogenase [Nocardioidaceae bacterium]|nr:L-gulono,4-lactone dehydrogenase [Nocardioidaceae bacterium]